MFDVAIIGYGPVGASLANLLGQAGLSVLVLEKDAEIYPLPRAIHFDGEVMRIFESAGLRAQVESVARPGLKGMHFVNAEQQTMLIRGGTALRGPHGCANNHYFHQPALERVLRQGVERFANVTVKLRHEVTQITPAGDHVLLELTALTELTQPPTQQRGSQAKARYVVGCDGARSIVRKTLGSPMKDLGLHQPWIVFDALLNDNAPALPDHTVQHCDPRRPMTYCNVTGNRRRWEIMLMPGDDPDHMVEPATLWTLVRPWIRPDQARIERAVIYSFHSLIAQGWRKDRLMLAGDAAHQMPPFLGQGLCAGLRDVSNLAWKLLAVLQSQASGVSPDSDALLDTYESERAPHVQTFIELAVRLGDIIQATDPAKAKERDARFKAGQPEIFEFPSPRLGPGLHDAAGKLAGLPFGQPELDNGELLDARLGWRFAVIARAPLLAAVSDSTRDTWSSADVAVLAGVDSRLAQWFDTHQVDAVVLRPDRYIMGVAKSAAQLDAITARIPVNAAQC